MFFRTTSRLYRIVNGPQRVWYSQQHQQAGKSNSQMTSSMGKTRKSRFEQDLITMDTAKKWKDMSPKERVVYATKQSSYTGITIAGLGLSATLLYLVLGELFGSDHATSVYNKSFDMVRTNDEVKNVLGEPVSGFRQHQRFSKKRLNVFEDASSGEKTAYMKYGISGPLNEGVVNVWLRENSSGKWDYEHVNVKVLGGFPRLIVVQENRDSK